MDNDSVNTADTLKALQGETISSVNVLGVNAVVIETLSGKKFMLEVESIMPTLGVYGLVCESI